MFWAEGVSCLSCTISHFLVDFKVLALPMCLYFDPSFPLSLETLISWPEGVALDETRNFRDLVENRLNREVGFPSTHFLLFSHKTFTFSSFPECTCKSLIPFRWRYKHIIWFVLTNTFKLCSQWLALRQTIGGHSLARGGRIFQEPKEGIGWTTWFFQGKKVMEHSWSSPQRGAKYKTPVT